MWKDRAGPGLRWLWGCAAAGVALLAGCAAGTPGGDAGQAGQGTPAPAGQAGPAGQTDATAEPDPAGGPASAEESGPTGGPVPADTPAPAEEPAWPGTTEVAYRIEARVVAGRRGGTARAEAEEFVATVRAVLADPRGWTRAGFRFVERADAPYTIVLAEGAEADALCAPYDTRGMYSCQNGPVVGLNADRWRSATPQWPAGVAEYRTMVINHEVGHLLHLHHPDPQCPGPGLPAPVMAQQSTELGECRPHPWPLQWEVDLAAERREPLAPPAHHDPSDHRPTPPPATR